MAAEPGEEEEIEEEEDKGVWCLKSYQYLYLIIFWLKSNSP
jgi:hypothetical protein